MPEQNKVSCDESKRHYRVPEEETISEEIELEEMTLTRREHPRRFGTGLGVLTDSKGSSISEDYIDEEVIDLLKQIQSSEAAAEASNDENRTIVTVADIHFTKDTTEGPSVDSSDRKSTHSAKKNFRLNQFPFIDMGDSEEILPEVCLPLDSDDEAGPAEKETSAKEVDEAHFWLNGYVDKQNCRIWREANPQVYVETPLHPEKLTVWGALWAGGILLQKR
ncbi:hypothetical protein TNCV_351231 [Trichonephila clavipes]|nr:hypothetical protein TNCV_351231 [Trichonephila clavipes]